MKDLFDNYPQTKYKIQQEKRQRQLMKSKSFVFDNAEGELFYIDDKECWLPSQKIIQRRESIKNLFKDIRQTALSYFELNDIEWWGQSEYLYYPTGHTLSSQIHCLNHLFAIRADHDAVLKIIQNQIKDIKDVLPSPIDEKFCVMKEYPYKIPSYISFEFTYNNKGLLNERCDKRGANCTSVDAFVYAEDNAGKNVLIPIEWKYTEAYEKTDNYKADEETIEKRYLTLANRADSNLGCWKDEYNWDPLYELARQTLLMEQIIREKTLSADNWDYQHIVVCPKDNVEMMADANAFKETLTQQGKERFHVIDPQDFLAPLKGEKEYADLFKYLEERYWE